MSKIKSREEALKDPSVLHKIEERAYYIAENTGFAPGRDHENWLTAEEEVLTKIMANGTAKPVKTPAKKALAAKAAPVAEVPKATAKPKAATAKATPAKAATTKAATTKTAPAKVATTKAMPAKAATTKSASKKSA